MQPSTVAICAEQRGGKDITISSTFTTLALTSCKTPSEEDDILCYGLLKRRVKSFFFFSTFRLIIVPESGPDHFKLSKSLYVLYLTKTFMAKALYHILF